MIPLYNRNNSVSSSVISSFPQSSLWHVNEKLAKIILQLHISEQTGRGVPSIVSAYSRQVFHFAENNIRVTIPFDRLGSHQENQWNAPVNAPVGNENAPVENENVPVDAPVEDRIILFCKTPKNILEIAEYLGYKDKRSVRKHLNPLLEHGRVAMTIPEKPNSRHQKYIAIK